MKWNAKERVAAVRISGMINRSWEFEPNNTCAVQFIHELANLILIDHLMRKVAILRSQNEHKNF